MNGFLVEASSSQRADFASAPGVVSVTRAPYFEPLLEDAVPQIGAIEVATNLGFTGKNVTIGVIDTGVDYTHKSLGGSGKVQDYDKARQNPSRAEGLFPNNKVIGGYDFAGTSYTGSNTPVVDEDPIDENGHGSHVSGITAGMTGNRNLHHGVAPDALILGLKVFGRTGGTNVAQDAV
jgi:subtilisin family serine protease